MKRVRMFLSVALVLLTGAVRAGSLLSGSIDFDTPELWGKSVVWGLTDRGTTDTANTYWYIENATDEDASAIVQTPNTASGYLKVFCENGLHRTVTPTLESGLGSQASGATINATGVYIDTTLKVDAACTLEDPKEAGADKLRCWLYQEEEATTATLVITAGTEPTNYVTEVTGIDPTVSHHLVVRALKQDGVIGFNVRWDDVLASCADGTTFFPSMCAAGEDRANELCSFGIVGSATVDYINFTRSNPETDPDYDKTDLSMLRQAAVFQVDGIDRGVALTNFPLLVRIATSGIHAIAGFSYATVGQNGNDLRFTDANGKVLSHEVDTWNTSGESLVWVKVPYLTRETRITMHWDLLPGAVAPASDATGVWDEYVAVWHFNGGETAIDSTGNGYTARLSGTGTLVSPAGAPLGYGGYVAKTSTDEYLALVAEHYQKTIGTDASFTFTGWYRATDWTTQSKPFAGTKWGKGVTINDAKGWGMSLNSKYALRMCGSGNVGYNLTNLPDPSANWWHVGFVRNGTSGLSFYYDGACFDDNQLTIAETDRSFELLLNGFAADELRIAKVARSADWIKAEYAQSISTNVWVSNKDAGSKGTYNYWVREPSVNPSSWLTNAYDAAYFDAGEARYGVIITKYYDAEGRELEDRPTVEPGSYKVVYTAKDGYHDALEKEIYFTIYYERPGSVLAGYNRVMLFNSFTNETQYVPYQGYNDIDADGNKIWLHGDAANWMADDPDGQAETECGAFASRQTTHTYCDPETGAELWTIRHGRLGNLCTGRSGAGGYSASMNYLPLSAGARRWNDSERAADRPRDAGCLILQNVTTETDAEDPARIESEDFTDGIGAIYFDAVNAYCGYENRLAVEVMRSDSTEWKRCKVDVFEVRGGAFVSVAAGQDEVVLNMNVGGGTDRDFYRVRALVNAGSARFRIVRTDTQEKGWLTSVDGDGVVLIDNLIVAPPSMGITLEQFGAPADETVTAIRGYRAPFDVAFPATNDLGKVHGAVKVNYIASGTNTQDAGFVGSLTMTYRWRYLNQYVGDWREILMHADPDDPTRFLTYEPLEGEGVGDIEYYFTSVVNAPYYQYYDFSDVKIGVPEGYDGERRESVSLSSSDEETPPYSAEHLSPALGTNFFIRIREGVSPFERIRLWVKPATADDAAAEAFDMKLAEDHLWRGYYMKPQTGAVEIKYRLELLNEQTTGATTYNWSTNYYCGTDQTEFGATEITVACGTNDWARIPANDLTGYTLFQYNDETHALTVMRADYQNFDGWTDALKTDGQGHFVGTYADLDQASGASRDVKLYTADLTGYRETAAENDSLWSEHFNGGTNETRVLDEWHNGSFPTPNGWTAHAAKYVPQNYRRVISGESLALQLREDGLGAITFSSATKPRGIDTVLYRARIAQSYDIYSFNYCLGTNTFQSLRDRTFVTAAAMTPSVTNEFQGQGAISVVGYYKDDLGCYEARLSRTLTNSFEFALYRWMTNGTDKPQSQRVAGPTTLTGIDTMGLNGKGNQFGALFISCETDDDRTYVTAGIRQKALTSPTYIGAESWYRYTFGGSNDKYYILTYTDKSSRRLTSGAFGMGSRDCPAAFADPTLFDPMPLDMKTGSVTFSGEAERLIYDESSFEDKSWTIRSRLAVKPFRSYPLGWGFQAQAQAQEIVVKDGATYEEVARTSVDTFGFTTYSNVLHDCVINDLTFETGTLEGGGQIVVDDIVVRQWAGIDYNDTANDDYGTFNRDGQIAFGSPTNFVYTRGWVEKDGGLLLCPARVPEGEEASKTAGSVSEIASVRSPLMDGLNGRGLGLGMISYAYREADADARLLVQVATNGISRGTLSAMTASLDGWVTVATNDFGKMTAEERKSGVLTTYLGLHGVTGALRVIVDPAVVAEAHRLDDPTYGCVRIANVAVRDNPKLDAGSWWGWNLRTTSHEYDPYKSLLEDVSLADAGEMGLSFGLNNSILDDIREEDADKYPQHKPFLQTPVFTEGVIGELVFKARKYAINDPAATVAIYATEDPFVSEDDARFGTEPIAEIVVNCDRYQTFKYSVPTSKKYTGFRLAVTGVDGVVGDKGPFPTGGSVERVLIDEVTVFQAVEARFAFRNVGAFRHQLDDLLEVPNVPSASEQPLCKESWGVQAEVYAALLTDKIDFTFEPQVTLKWFFGEYPWGYANWKDSEAARSATLTRVSGLGERYVYRSSLRGDPDSVIDGTNDACVVQYMLEVVYKMKDKSDCYTNILSSVDWVRPAWYDPIDLNEGKKFSAYTVLDTVAPGWAWINEVNLFGYEDDSWNNSDDDIQYFEIAAPEEADLTDWSVHLVIPDTGNQTVLTNVIATFGYDGLDGKKKNLTGHDSGMVFRVLASPKVLDAEPSRLKKSDGTLDATWSFSNPDGSTFMSDGSISHTASFGIQLVRPSGIVEHEVVVIGTNYWENAAISEYYRNLYHPSNTVNNLNAYMTRANFFLAPYDDAGEPYSISVITNNGSVRAEFANTMVRTPGRINKYANGTTQYIDADHPTPLGSSILLRCGLADPAHILQSFDGGASFVSNDVVLVIQKGKARGTNILYQVANWYEMGSVTVDGSPIAYDTYANRRYEVRVGQNASSDIRVVATPTICQKLRDIGLDENDRYTPAILAWLDAGCSLDGHPWPDSDGEIYMATNWPIGHLDYARPLTLKEMYWLDMCPTVPNQYLCSTISQFIPPQDDGDRTIGVYMAISNGLERLGETVYAPYVLRSVTPGVTSWDYATNAVTAAEWTSVAFSIDGILWNGIVDASDEDAWVALRSFVFVDDSFRPRGSTDAYGQDNAFTTDIVVRDPFALDSPGFAAGWYTWWKDHGVKPPVYHKWTLGEKGRLFDVEILHSGD